MRKVTAFHRKILSIGGAEKYLFDLSSAMISQGVDLEIVSYETKLNIPLKLSNKIICVNNIFGLLSYCIKNKNRIYYTAYGEADLFLISLISKISFSIIMHQPSLMTFKPDIKQSFFYHKKIKKHISEEVWCKLNEDYKKYSLYKKAKHEFSSWIKYFAWKKSKKIIVWSDFAVNEKSTLFNLKCEKIIGAYFNDELYANIINITRKKKYDCVVVARLEKNKRLLETINGFAHLKKHYPLVGNLIILGDGPQRDELELLVQKLDITNYVEFWGFVERNEVDQVMRNSRVLLALDWADFRLTLYEAIIRGCRVIVEPGAEVDNYLLSHKIVSKTRLDPCSIALEIKNVIKMDPINQSDLPIEHLEKLTWENYSNTLLEQMEQ